MKWLYFNCLVTLWMTLLTRLTLIWFRLKSLPTKTVDYPGMFMKIIRSNFLTSWLAEIVDNSWIKTVGSKMCMCPKLLHLFLTLCEPMDNSPPGSSAHGILQARILEWFAMPSSWGSSRPGDQTCVSFSSCTTGSSLLQGHWESPKISLNCI